MAVKTVRKIVSIDEDKCNGCGACADKCAEGALEIINGKAKLVSENYCDGLGVCLGECPEGAIIIEERPAVDFDEEAVAHHLEHLEHEVKAEPLPCGCSGTQVRSFEGNREETTIQTENKPQRSALRHWPVQLALVPPRALFFQGADLLLTAHCVPAAYGGFHEDLLKDHALVISCPKLDDSEAHLEKLTQVIKESNVRSLTVARMEVPCCAGLTFLAKKAIAASGKRIPFLEIVVGVQGDIKS